MPWTSADQEAAEREIKAGLNLRAMRDPAVEVDDDPRVVAAMAPENVGNTRHPRGPLLEGDRLRRRLTSGRFDRWATIVWRAELATQASRSLARRARWADGPQPSPGPNRAQRRANPGKYGR